MRITSHSARQTLALGRLLGALAAPPPTLTVIALDGPLGAGKTLLTRGIALGARVLDPDLVSSPTYVIMNIYPGPKPLHHFDAYRLPSPQALSEIGFDDILTGSAADGTTGGGIVIVEWAQRVAELLPADTLWIHMSHEPLATAPPDAPTQMTSDAYADENMRGEDMGGIMEGEYGVRRSLVFTAGGPVSRALLEKMMPSHTDV